MELTLRPLDTQWKTRLELAREVKERCFDSYVREALAFYVGPENVADFYSEFMEGARGVYQNAAELTPGFRMVPLKVAELVQIIGPTLYHRNPVRTVTKRARKLRPRELVVDPAMEEDFQQLQGQYQQLQQAGPEVDPRMVQQLQGQLQQLGQALQAADQKYQEMSRQHAADDRIRSARAELFDQLLNYTPDELDLKGEMRLVLVETLIKGMGCLWQEPVTRGETTLVGSFFDTVDHLLIDPDMETWRDVRWVSRCCVSSVSDLARMYNLPEDELRKKAAGKSWFEEGMEQGHTTDGGLHDPHEGDILVYQKVYSRMGCGRIKGLDERLQRVLDGLGNYVYLVLAKGYEYPLNLPSTLLEAYLEAEDALAENPDDPDAQETMKAAEQQLMLAAAWPIPSWMDDKFPLQTFYFHTIPNSVWPMAHIRAGMQQLKWLAYSMNHLADRARQTSRLIFGIREDLEEENKRKLESGDPVTVLKVSESAGPLNDYMTVLQLPQSGAGELMRVTEDIEDSFEKATGLTEMAYGTLGGSRSAAESNYRQSALNVRPDDMANKVEEGMTGAARLEALASAWLLEASDVAAILGPDAGELWAELVEILPLTQLVLELDFRVEAGSARKPNRETQIQSMNETMQVVGPMVSQLVSMGQPGPWNAMIQEWARVNEIANVERFLVPPPPPPQPPAPPEPDPNLQLQMQIEQQKSQFEMQKMQMEMGIRQQEAEMRRQQMEIKLQGEQIKLQLNNARYVQEQQQDAEKHALKMGRQIEQDALVEAERKSDDQ